MVAVVNNVHCDFTFDPSDISTLWLSVGHHLDHRTSGFNMVHLRYMQTRS
jgi:hypothetical protein